MNVPTWFAVLSLTLTTASAIPVTITTQPKDRTVTDQSTVTFAVGAEGSPPVKYQWFRDGVALGGATNAVLSLPHVTYADQGAAFKVIVSNLVEGAPSDATSSAARLRVVTPAAALTHRYSFAADASDSVGHADGTLHGAAAIRDGQVHLNGTRGTYVNLPGGLIAGDDTVTFEFWASLGTNRSWARVFDQGSTNGNSGQHDLYFCPHSGRDFRLTIMDPHPRERVVTIPGNLDNRTNLHVACVLDPASGFMGIYTNGVLAGSRNDLVSLGSVDTNLFFLGRSLFASDAPLNGSIDEFRIYNVALSAAVIAADYTNGPNAILSADRSSRRQR